MTFHAPTLADEIARRTADLLDSGQTLSRDEIVERLLAEDGRAGDPDWFHPYSSVVGDVMTGEREVRRQPPP